jgi:flagellar biosynthesis anti-sigma factor FlgM
MRVQNANLAPLDLKDQSRRKQTQSITPRSGDDVHLSELVRSLRSLVADSPERQQRIEQIARAYAEGAYQMDAEATAGKLIDDALKYRS